MDQLSYLQGLLWIETVLANCCCSRFYSDVNFVGLYIITLCGGYLWLDRK